MLVLTRKRNEDLVIDDIIVRIVDMKFPNTVKVGIIAPRHMKIKRRELVELDDLEKREMGHLQARLAELKQKYEPDFGAGI